MDTTLHVETNLTVRQKHIDEFMQAVSQDEEVLAKWQEIISFIAQKYQMDIDVKGSKWDIKE